MSPHTFSICSDCLPALTDDDYGRVPVPDREAVADRLETIGPLVLTSLVQPYRGGMCDLCGGRVPGGYRVAVRR